MSNVVNNTTKGGLLDLICPHSCRGCGALGTVLCECCKNDMENRLEMICPICKEKFAKLSEKRINTDVNGKEDWRICENCEMPFLGLWSCGWRTGALEKVVEEFKYQSVWAMKPVLIELLDVAIPLNFGRDGDVTIVPLPTIGKHVRERGIDHTWAMARGLAKKRGWRCERLLARAVDTVQVGTKAADRKTQAEKAYELSGKVEVGRKYVLLDDVWTTGASMMAAAKVMKEIGVEELYGVVVAVSKGKEQHK